jgi:hypothetical protein
MKLTEETQVLGEKPVPVPLCPPQIPHGTTRDWTRASAVRGRWLTAWAMARSTFLLITCKWYLRPYHYRYPLFVNVYCAVRHKNIFVFYFRNANLQLSYINIKTCVIRISEFSFRHTPGFQARCTLVATWHVFSLNVAIFREVLSVTLTLHSLFLVIWFSVPCMCPVCSKFNDVIILNNKKVLLCKTFN